MSGKNDILKNIPQVDEILKDAKLIGLMETMPRDFVVNCVRECIADLKSNILNDVVSEVNKEKLIINIIDKVSKKSKLGPMRLINATGTVLHTNLGRSILSKKAVDAIYNVANSYTNLEYDIKSGDRGDRQSHVEKLIVELTGCEAAMVVNNNAAATILVLSALAKHKEVILSRGELIEIGGSFRLPDVMSESNAILKEIGTTNRTKLTDYKKAINENTAAILKVHTSNYKIVGFTEEAKLEDLIKLGKEEDMPVIYDMGNGLFIDLHRYGIDEPNVKDLVKKGPDVILFSGDKLLGGPQAGIIIGKEKYISKMKKDPLARAFRVDKFTLASLNATLFEYFDEKKAIKNIPVLNMVTISENELIEKSKRLIEILKDINGIKLDIEKVKDQVGGGTAPEVLLDGAAVTIVSDKIPSEKLERKLRAVDIPIIVRVAHDKIYLDVRTIKEEEFDIIKNELKEIFI